MTTSNEHNNAPAVPQGWKLVPVEPTRAMWAAVNKLNDEMAAGSYDGKGCSIEQAWNCMLDFAPDAPALEATPAPEPAQDEPLGHFRVEPFGWTDCAKDDEGAIALYERPQEVGLTDEEIEAIAKKHMSTVGDHWCNEDAIREIHAEDFARAIIAALLAKWGQVMDDAQAPAPAQEPSRPQNCGTSYCSCIECVCEPAQEVGLTDETQAQDERRSTHLAASGGAHVG